MVGGVIITFTASSNQKCVTKSPTDSEAVTLTNYICFIELFQSL
jgi:hypothetical protein